MNSDSFNSEEDSNNSMDEEINPTEESEIEKIELTNLNLLKAISSSLTLILEENQNLNNYQEKLRKQKRLLFTSSSIPNISIYDYLIRIQRYSIMEKNTLILSLIFIDRLCEYNNIILTYNNVHRILFVSIVIAIKYNEDKFYDNKYYAQIGGISLNELNKLENLFLEMCQFKLYVSSDVFEKYSKYLNSFEKIDNISWIIWNNILIPRNIDIKI